MSSSTPMSHSGTPLGGLEALVAAASAAKQVGQGDRRRRKAGDDLIDPALMGGGEGDTAQALASLFTNPIFVQALAATTQQQQQQQVQQPIPPPIQSNQNNQTNLYTTLLSNMMTQPQSLTQSQIHPGSSQTPFQQTRSGRISRPPVNPPQYNLLQALAAEANSPNFEGLLKDVSSTSGLNGGNGTSHEKGKKRQLEDDSAQQWNDLHAAMGSHSWDTDLGFGQGLDNDTEGDFSDGNLPAWPLPPAGPGGRKAMPKDEMLARRRARNRVAAVESRKKKREHIHEVESRLRAKDATCMALEMRCHLLEQQIDQLQQIILSAGLSLPSNLPTPNPTISNTNTFPPSMPTFPTISNDTPATYNSYDETLPSFDMFFNVDMDGEDDGEFLPPTSPIPSETGEHRGRRGKRRKRNEEDEDDEFEDDEVEDEDLFLPIEDVPIPPAAQMESAMRSLGVDNQEQLASLINKMVASGKEGMTGEMVEKLKVLLALVGPNGTWSTGGEAEVEGV